MKKSILLAVLMPCFPFYIMQAKVGDAQNAKEAKALFNKIYAMVFGEQGSSLTYSVNIIGLYKTQGNIIYKGKKLQYQESRYAAWEDGVTAYMVDKKKRKVKIYDFDDDAKDEYLSKFKYDVNNFDFSYRVDGGDYIIYAKLRKHSFFGISKVEARVTRKTLIPQSLTIHLSLLKTTVKITNFKSGGITDASFVFPASLFKGYTFEDRRKNKHISL